MKEQLFNILDHSGYKMFNNLAYDEQCSMYYWPESNGFVTDDQIKENHWVVTKGDFYELPDRYN